MIKLALVLFTFAILFDANKIQPYNVLFYGILLFDLISPQHIRANLVIMLSGVYLWSGIHKLNVFYFDEVVWLLDDFNIHWLKPLLLEYLNILPYVEILMGLTLLAYSGRIWLHRIFILFHLLTVLFLICIDYNHIVIPWNIMMIGFHLYLGYGGYVKWCNFKHSILILPFLAFWMFPMVNLFTPRFSYLSWNVYSFKIPYGILYLDNREKLRPEIIDKFVYTKKDDFTNIDLLQSSMKLTGVSINPEPWIYKQWMEHLEKVIPHTYNCYGALYIYTNSKSSQEIYKLSVDADK